MNDKDFSYAILDTKKMINQICEEKRLWNNHDLCAEAFEEFYKMVYNQIHNVLAMYPSEENEKDIREIISRFVIGFRGADGKKHEGMLSVLENKLNDMTRFQTVDQMSLKYKFSKLYEDFYALAAFRSMKHFATIMEWDLEEDKRIHTMTMNCFGGYWYYATQAILNFTWKKIFTQAPTGMGKSYKDTTTIAFILGYDVNADILKVTGNPATLSTNSQRLVKYMLKPMYAKVFPYYAQFECNRDKMFDVAQMGGVEKPTRLLVHGSEKGESLLMCNKLTPIDGSRFKYKFYDDVTRSKDKAKLHIHQQDIEMYDSEWERRKYDDYHNLEFFSGTAYHNEDFICTLKRRMGADAATRSPVNKYTWFNERTKCVFVKVPKLDYDTDEITFPQMFDEAETKRKRDENPREFYSMDQQEPMPIEGCPFDYKNIMTYSFIPREKNGDEPDACYAILDPARTGANYVAMAIFVKVQNLFYLKDVIYEMRPIEELHSTIVEKIIKHNVTQFHIERNTDTSLKTLLEKMAIDRGYGFCKFTEVYTTKNKKDKIAENEAAIRNNLVFPDYTMYGQGSQMRNFMRYFTGYSYLENNKYDDAPDCVAMFAERFLRSASYSTKARCLQL